MAKYKLWVVAAATVLLLAGCTSLQSNSSSSSSTKSTKKLQTTGKVTDSMYEGVIDNNQYKTSQTRGLTTQQSNTAFDVKSLESGLLNISKKNNSLLINTSTKKVKPSKRRKRKNGWHVNQKIIHLA